MDTKLAALLMMTCFFIQAFTAESKVPIIDTVKTLFSLPVSYDSWILNKAKAILFRQGMPYFAPPISDCSNGEETRTGAREKVKEAAIKSMDKSKETVEDSARSAARLAEEAVDKTVKKLKKTLSTKHRTEEDEL